MRKELSKSVEDYLETILKIVREKGYARVKDIAEELDVRPASVTEMLNKLSSEGLVNYEKYSGVTLTDEGRERAEKINRVHETLKKLLILIGVPEEIAEEDACKIEHVLHEETVKKIVKLVEAMESNENNLSGDSSL
ncbi:MAG: DtxR family transcriptional regulator, Mn-dependent transcriptional regulator [Archaeoglobi archaeon]|nr:metal-dependent transcriptional regulator [Candidatus Mnemosynella bozhongmuii]MDI3502188.1 DtxR family transcriptional regulator, Mn-dependent transcriptional regulator [Archaeoglobi archaeon]MDK2782179.1 DtxR family transcriptional regulator, Mn-dependent transcriptional regulator [Archaeoglobi archaeon]